jgi:hypothetical protein
MELSAAMVQLQVRNLSLALRPTPDFTASGQK